MRLKETAQMILFANLASNFERSNPFSFRDMTFLMIFQNFSGNLGLKIFNLKFPAL